MTPAVAKRSEEPDYPMEEAIYHLPEEYDLEHARPEPDVDFYVSLAQRWRPRRILELGCGTGRVTIPLASRTPDAVKEVVGLDREPKMLRAARRKALELTGPPARRLRWVRGDLRTWEDRRLFDLIIAPCGTLCHLLSLEDQLATWRVAFRNLTAGGRFIADVAMAELATLAESLQNPPRAIVEMDNDTSQGGSDERTRLLRYKTVIYHAAQQRATVRFLYDEFKGRRRPARFISDFERHVYYPRELELLFLVGGFQIEAIWGGYHGLPLRNRSRSLVMVGVKPA